MHNMKKLLSTILLLPALAFGAANYDITPGIDLSGVTSVTAAQLNQLVNRAVAATNKGFIVYGASTPDTANNVHQKRYLWLDSSSMPPAIKVYNTNTSTWVPQPVTTGSISTNELAANAVISGKVAANAIWSTNIVNEEIAAEDIASGSIISRHLFQGDTVSNMHLATRSIEGGYGGKLALATLTHTNIAAGTIQGFNLAAQTITSNYIAAGQVFEAHIAPTNITTALLKNDAVQTDKITNGAVTAAKIADNTITTNKLETNIVASLPRAWGAFDAAGTLLRGYGITSVTKLAANGTYVVVLSAAAPTSNYVVTATTINDSGSHTFARYATNSVNGFTIMCSSAAGSLATPGQGVAFQLIY